MNLHRWRPWLLTLMLAVLAGCAGVAQPNHTFDFRPKADSPDVRVLDWKYSVWGLEQWEKDAIKKEYRGHWGTNVTGRFPVGDSIYVKWQVPPDSTVYERRINLKGLLPFSMEGSKLILMFRSAQPHVYLVQPGKDGACPGTTCPMTLSSDTEKIARVFSRDSVTQIYPGPSKPIVNPLPKLSRD